MATLVHRNIGPSLFRGRACVEHGLIQKKYIPALPTRQLRIVRYIKYLDYIFLHIFRTKRLPCALITNMSGKCNSRAGEKPEDKYYEQTMFVVEKMIVLYVKHGNRHYCGRTPLWCNRIDGSSHDEK